MPQALQLLNVFHERADGVRLSDMQLVGYFGEGIPEPLISAAGGCAIDVKAPPLQDAVEGPLVSAVSAVVENFMDSFAARFLHRYAAGAFDDYAMIIFARDDVAALAAYQYVRELKRQGRVGAGGPQLHLWNMLHTHSEPAHAFNLCEFDKLTTVLCETLGTAPKDLDLETAFEDEKRRTDIVAQLPAGGADAFIARNVGRWLTPSDHVALLQNLPTFAKEIPNKNRSGHSIALVGTACDIPILHEICEEYGTIIADIQDYGQEYGAANTQTDDLQSNGNAVNTADEMMRSLATAPLHIRAVPPVRFSNALAGEVANADLVISCVDNNDDAFGWEVPTLRKKTKARGGQFIDLGFRPFRPDNNWRDEARNKIERVFA